MQYKCLINRNGLTKDRIYKEKMPYPCSFNASVVNDEGTVIFVPRRQYFKVMKDD